MNECVYTYISIIIGIDSIVFHRMAAEPLDRLSAKRQSGTLDGVELQAAGPTT